MAEAWAQRRSQILVLRADTSRRTLARAPARQGRCHHVHLMDWTLMRPVALCSPAWRSGPPTPAPLWGCRAPCRPCWWAAVRPQGGLGLGGASPHLALQAAA